MKLLRTSIVLAGLSLLACEVLLPETLPSLPLAPSVVGPAEAVGMDTLVLRGTRPANTALLLDDVEVIARARVGSFDIVVALAVGTNRFTFVAVDAVGRRSEPVIVTVVRDGIAPAGVVITSPLPARTGRDVLFDVEFKKPGACLVKLDGAVLPIDRDDDSGVVDIDLVPGKQTRRFACVDNADNEGPVTAIDIERVDVGELFELDASPADVSDSAYVLTARCDDGDIVAAIEGGPLTACTAGAWTGTATLVPGAQTLTVTAAFSGELDIGAVSLVPVTYTPPAEAVGEEP